MGEFVTEGRKKRERKGRETKTERTCDFFSYESDLRVSQDWFALIISERPDREARKLARFRESMAMKTNEYFCAVSSLPSLSVCPPFKAYPKSLDRDRESARAERFSSGRCIRIERGKVETVCWFSSSKTTTICPQTFGFPRPYISDCPHFSFVVALFSSLRPSETVVK